MQFCGPLRKKNSQDGETIHVLINGTDYKDAPPRDETIQVKQVDDDRFNFCKGELSVTYPWGLLEMYGLCDFGMQNCEMIGLSDGRVRSARDGGLSGAASARGAASGARRGRDQMRATLVDMADQLPISGQASRCK